MNAFISYSISDNEHYILNLLAKKLAEVGLSLVASTTQLASMDFHTRKSIESATLFIGLITKAGPLAKTNNVFIEFKHANLLNKPAILLIEEGVPVSPWQHSYQNTIFFNRHNINTATTAVRDRIAHTPLDNPKPDAAAWLLGGLAVLALLAYLSDDKK